MLDVQIREQDGATFCRPVGELDTLTVATFRQSLAEVVTGAPVVIDLSEVSFVDSAGLGALISGVRRSRELGGAIVVACAQPSVERLLSTTGLDRIVPVVANDEHAIAALAALGTPDAAQA